jgi:hypothetical protein
VKRDTSSGMCANGRQPAASTAADGGKPLPPALPSETADRERIGPFINEESSCL